MEVKINKKKLIENKERKKRQGFMIPGDYEIYARACFYLNEKEEAIEYFNKASNEIDAVIKTYEKRKELENVAKTKHIKANYLRLAGKKEESQKLYKEVKELYKKVLPKNFIENLERWCTVIDYLGEVCFFLRAYEECYEYGKLISWDIPISALYSKGILDNDKQQIEDAVNLVIKENKREKANSNHYAFGKIRGY